MKKAIEVQSKREGEIIEEALKDPTTRAFVQVVGALLPFSQRERKRILTYVADKLDEENAEA